MKDPEPGEVEIHGAGGRATSGGVDQGQRVTVGRIVHYQLAPSGLGTIPASEREPMAAVVTRVHAGGINQHVALEVFGFEERCVHRSVPYSPVPRAGFWSWPPRV